MTEPTPSPQARASEIAERLRGHAGWVKKHLDYMDDEISMVLSAADMLSEAEARLRTAESRDPRVCNISEMSNAEQNVYAGLGFTAADFSALQDRLRTAEAERDALAKFNPDWDLLRATQESLREHMQLLAQARRAAFEEAAQMADRIWHATKNPDVAFDDLIAALRARATEEPR